MKRYRVIVKVGNDRFLKYRNVSNFDRFIAFLETKWPAWRWYNVYDKEGNQVSNRTNKKAKN